MPFEIIRSFAPEPKMRDSAAQFPYAELEVGDAFMVPYEKENTFAQRQRLNARNQHMQSKLSRRFSLRSGEDGFYILRTQ